MKQLYYCIEKQTLKVLSFGFLPEVWGNITGMSDISTKDAMDLTWAGYPDHGFFTETAALKLGVLKKDLETAYQLGKDIQTLSAKEQIANKLLLSDWVVVKYTELGTTIPDNWKRYRQELRDLSTSTSYPWEIVFPNMPTTFEFDK